MSYLFKSFIGVPRKDSKEWAMVEKFCECWTNFAYSGNPNGTITSLSPKWEPVDVARDDNGKLTYKCYNFGEEIDFIDYPELERVQFWDQMYEHFKRELY